MKPIKQTTFGIQGNCFAACVASILELNLDDLPVHWTGPAVDPGTDWWQEFQDWLAERGMYAIEIYSDQPAIYPVPPGIHCIMNVPSPGLPGMLHSIVGVSKWKDGIHPVFCPNGYDVTQTCVPKSITFIVRRV